MPHWIRELSRLIKYSTPYIPRQRFFSSKMAVLIDFGTYDRRTGKREKYICKIIQEDKPERQPGFVCFHRLGNESTLSKKYQRF